MHLGPWSNNRGIFTRSWELCTLLTVMSCDKVRLPLARDFGLTTDLSYSITCRSSFLDYSAISTVRGTLLTDDWLMQRKISRQPVSSSTCRLTFVFYWQQKPYKQIWFNCMQWTAGASMAHLAHNPQYKSHLCVLKLGMAPTQRYISAGCIDLRSCDQLGVHFAVLWPSSLVCLWEKCTWIKLPKWRNIFPPVFSRSQLTSLLLLSQSWRDAWRKFAGSTLLSGCGWYLPPISLHPGPARVSLLLSQGQRWRQRVILWQKKNYNASQPPALHLTVSGAKTSLCTASVLPCAVIRLCWTCS